MDASKITLRNVEKTYNDNTKALKSTQLEVEPGEVLVLLGPSGCGKSTLLRLIAGLETPSQGQILFDDQDVTSVDPERREIGFVFQNYALFPTMTVSENICFGMKVKKVSKTEQKAKLEELLDMLNIKELKDKRPMHLSGGQQQRVAIARALATNPRILLLDEPLTALDAQLKNHLILELSELFQKLGVTTIYVTHDQKEAMAIANRIAVMNAGSIEQIGTPIDIYQSPETAFVAQFVGQVNRFTGKVKKVGSENVLDFGIFQLDQPEQVDKEEVQVFIRPEDIHLDKNGSISLKVKNVVFLGEKVRVIGQCGEQTIVMDVDNHQLLTIGQEVKVSIRLEKIISA